MTVSESTGPEPPASSLAGVIFDMDGVLLESEPFIAAAAVKMFAEKGVAVVPEEFRPFIGTGEDRFLGGVAEARGVSLDMPRDKVRTYEIYLDLIAGRLEALPGVGRFLAECRRRGLKTAVASSADRMKVEGNLKEIHLTASDFQAIIVGEDVTNKKPAPDIFLEAARRLNLAPGACVTQVWDIDSETGVGATQLSLTVDLAAYGNGTCGRTGSGGHTSANALWGAGA